MPTALEKTGDFSQALTPQGNLQTIYDPYTTVFNPVTDTVTRTPFPGNKIPPNRIGPTAAKLTSYLWAPNNPGDDLSGLNNFKKVCPWYTYYWNTSDRVDYYVGDKVRIYARFSKYQTRFDSGNFCGTTIACGADKGGVMDALNAAAAVLWTPTARTMVDFRFGCSYAEDDSASAWAQVPTSVYAGLWPNSNWYTYALPPLLGVYFPLFNFNGNGSSVAGEGGSGFNHERSYNPTINVTHGIGKHNIKVGWQLRYSYDPHSNGTGSNMAFNSVDTGSSFLGYNAAQSGNMYASGLLGALNSGSITISPNLTMRQQQWAYYFQDDIKLNRNITLNLGLRWERETAPAEESRILVQTLDLTNAIPELQGLTMPSQVTSIAKINYKFNGAMIYTSNNNPRMYDAPWSTFLPRTGIAVRINDKTAFRAGYARYAIPWVTIHQNTGTLPTNGYSQSTAMLGPLQGMPRTQVSDPFPSTNPVVLPAGNTLGRYTDLGNSIPYFWDKNIMKTPLNDRINFTVERQAPQRIFTQATFFMMFEHNAQDPSAVWGGGYGYNLNMMDPNLAYQYKGLVDQAVPNPFYGLPSNIMPGTLATQPTVAASQLLRPYPQYGDLDVLGWPGMSDHYYALQLEAQRPMAQGLTFLVGYNYSREYHGAWFNDEDLYNNKITMFDRGNWRQDLRMAGTWQLPVGKGRRYLNHAHPVVDAILGGWATSHIYMWRSGDLLQFGAAQVSGDPTKNVPAGHYFNPAVFSVLPAYTPRTNPLYYEGLRGPGFWQLDSTLVKYFPISERVRFQLRMEFYNLLNAFMPSDPDLGVGSGTMGRSTWVGTGNYGREIQYTARIEF
jgi:hypothetical protein